ncbi:hypothetical protein NDN08_004675 [Rhodosorus marinus]|uniref:Uncharacterized protein n=1 Tax=Rhodosorus marinus TaxID=101924 RepID=A0AAV8UPZ6_9RHOD|nr:hypothetical protein NDN08_004675 [Rhodosorus marinus]
MCVSCIEIIRHSLRLGWDTVAKALDGRIAAFFCFGFAWQRGFNIISWGDIASQGGVTEARWCNGSAKTTYLKASSGGAQFVSFVPHFGSSWTEEGDWLPSSIRFQLLFQ